MPTLPVVGGAIALVTQAFYKNAESAAPGKKPPAFEVADTKTFPPSLVCVLTKLV